jgi:hypothetical protein
LRGTFRFAKGVAKIGEIGRSEMTLQQYLPALPSEEDEQKAAEQPEKFHWDI